MKLNLSPGSPILFDKLDVHTYFLYGRDQVLCIKIGKDVALRLEDRHAQRITFLDGEEVIIIREITAIEGKV